MQEHRAQSKEVNMKKQIKIYDPATGFTRFAEIMNRNAEINIKQNKKNGAVYIPAPQANSQNGGSGNGNKDGR